MKILAVTIFIFSVTLVLGQNQLIIDNIDSKVSINKFEVSLSTFNHAERFYNGTTTYLLTESSIKVTKIFFGNPKSNIVYENSIPKTQMLISKINNIELDSLHEFYFNNCVMITSGNEYFLDFVNNKSKKSISLHHYYLKQLDDIIQLINSNLPKKYQFQYLTKDTKQDCSL